MNCPDSRKGPLEKRIRQAAELFREKTGGKWPVVCRVPEALVRGRTYPRVSGLKVRSDTDLEPGVFVFE